MRRAITGLILLAALSLTGITIWIAYPTQSSHELEHPLEPWVAGDAMEETYSRDFPALVAGFTPQKYRSFCGPASLATILRAYGITSVHQSDVPPTLGAKLNVFYSGTTLSELAALAENAGLSSEAVFAESLTVDTFRERLKNNLQQHGNYVLVNYDRRVLRQAGAGHISALGAYDPARDAFLVLDEAAFKYPFTWVPANLLYGAVHTKDGPRYRGLLIIHAHRDRD